MPEVLASVVVLHSAGSRHQGYAPVSNNAVGMIFSLFGHVRCEEKYRLLDLFKAAVASYSIAVADLDLTRGKASKGDYDRLVGLSNVARKASESARLALEQHVAAHGC
jgi:hypothetical protein